MSAWQVWLLAGVALSIAEMMVPGFFLLSMGLGCLVAALSSLFLDSLPWQVMAFAGGSLVAFVFFRPLAGRMQKKPQPFNAEAYIGREGHVTEAVGPAPSGRIFLGGEIWKARSAAGDLLPEGTRVVVRQRQGLVMVVEPADPRAPQASPASPQAS